MISNREKYINLSTQKKDGTFVNTPVWFAQDGDKNSYSINQLKEIFKVLKLNQDERSIKLAYNLVNKLRNQHPAKIFSKNTSDFNHNSGIVDFLLHKQETFFSIKDKISSFVYLV